MRKLVVYLVFTLATALQAQEDRDPASAIFEMDSLVAQSLEKQQKWHPFFKGEKLLGGIYMLRVGEEDRQQPHETDEVYYVVKGRAQFKAEGEPVSVAAGSILFVRAKIPHRFFDITEDLQVLVFFDQ
ncbi:cupin domain-containing protein [Spongiimicrobium sp. 2-473A-2-J]|uniref:cupin domain-containing protein n=1 Tax=Eudoraea algarum TaxID=3417568 RepID=UPI003D36B92F